MQFKEFDYQKELVKRAKKLAQKSQIPIVVEKRDSIRFDYKKKKKNLSIYSFVIGSRDKTAPTFGLFGGVHGLEKVGTHVILSYLDTLFNLLNWDDNVSDFFKTHRLVTIPLINPAGMFLGKRSNANNVDLMRDAPVEADEGAPKILGGHYLSPKLPFYRGDPDSMQKESLILEQFLIDEVFPAKVSLALDCHSGFGAKDRLWYPYAKTKNPIKDIAHYQAIEKIYNKTHPNNVYSIETQSQSYTANGDLWDHFYDQFQSNYKKNKKHLFLPWTLEMGSWLWVRKNPPQILSSLGIFNPTKPHRLRRTLRRHKPLLNFFLRIASNHKTWNQ